MGKFEKYVTPMFLRQDEVKRPHRPGTWVFGQEYRFMKEYCPFTPLLVEYIPLMPTQAAAMAKFDQFADKDKKDKDIPKAPYFHTANIERDGHKGGSFYGQIRHEAEMLWIFLGTDPEHPEDLGCTIRFNVGLAEDAQTFEFSEPCCIHVPRGLANCGMKILDQKRTIININVFDQPTKEACYIEHTYYPVPTEEGVVIENGSERHYKCSDVECELG